jgi:hypothetical protein
VWERERESLWRLEVDVMLDVSKILKGEIKRLGLQKLSKKVMVNTACPSKWQDRLLLKDVFKWISMK